MEGFFFIKTSLLEPRIKEDINRIEDLWLQLWDHSNQKRHRIEEVQEEHNYNVDINDLLQWINAVEEKLKPQDSITDLSQLQQQQKKLQSLEADINGAKNKIDDLIDKAKQLEEKDHFNLREILSKKVIFKPFVGIFIAVISFWYFF